MAECRVSCSNIRKRKQSYFSEYQQMEEKYKKRKERVVSEIRNQRKMYVWLGQLHDNCVEDLIEADEITEIWKICIDPFYEWDYRMSETFVGRQHTQ